MFSKKQIELVFLCLIKCYFLKKIFYHMWSHRYGTAIGVKYKVIDWYVPLWKSNLHEAVFL